MKTGFLGGPRDRSRLRATCAALATMALASCAQVLDPPMNTLLDSTPAFAPAAIPDGHGDGSVVVGLAFSGGGTRAAAYAYGILRQLEDTPLPGGGRMTDAVRMVSGASGGAITAAYFALKGPRAYHDLRERFLDRDAEASMHTSAWSPTVIAGALSGGINGRGTFARWLDENVFDGARYAAFARRDAPAVWINASDVWNSTPFLFSHDTFAALCSDIGAYPIADAVAASAGVPVVFKPVALAADRPHCGYRRPDWLRKALEDPFASMRIRAEARALDNYQARDRLRVVKLMDGGLTDNLGLTGFTVSRAAARTPYAPLSARQAVRLRTLVYLVSDAGRRESIDWGESLRGPGAADTLMAMTNTMVDASARHEFDAMQFAVKQWSRDLIAYRCGLPSAEVRRLRGSLAGWDCRDVRVIFDDISFDDLTSRTQEGFREVETRLKLPPEQVALSIAAGREALLRNNGFREALAHMNAQRR